MEVVLWGLPCCPQGGVHANYYTGAGHNVIVTSLILCRSLFYCSFLGWIFTCLCLLTICIEPWASKSCFLLNNNIFFSSCYFHTNPSAMYSDKSTYFAQFYWIIHFNFLTFNSRMFSHFFIFSRSPLGVSRFPFPTLYLAFLIPLIHVRDKISEMYILNLDRYKYYYP